MNRYDNRIECEECNEPLNLNNRIFRDYKNHNFCSSFCKWRYVYHDDCSQHGKRPVVPGSWWWAEHEAFRRDNFKCQKCGSVENLEAHHRIPTSKGGNSLPENLITLCHDCHMKPGMHRGTRARSVLRSRKVDPSTQSTFDKVASP
jgi:hypothetical protein